MYILSDWYCLSVSSTGSISLQQHGNRQHDLHGLCLSVSSTGSISLQPLRPPHLSAPLKLSVSSTGSISLQRNLDNDHEHCLRYFQYPQPDRYPCNQSIPGELNRIQITFSILNRIDIPATTVFISVFAAAILAFSILNRIDIPATSKWSYSRSSIGTFSILNRIDIPATER